MDIYESLSEILDESQLASFKVEVESTILDAVKKQTESILAKSENDTALQIESIIDKADNFVEMQLEEKSKALDAKHEELTQFVEDKAEEYSASKIADAKEILEAEFDEKLVSLEETVVSSLDAFLENEISEKISDSLLDTIAEQQVLLPLVNGIKSLFEDKFVAIDSEGANIIKDLEYKNESLKATVDETIQEKIELSNLAEAAATKLLVSESCEDLTISESDRVKTFFEGKSFDEVSSKIGKYVTLVEGENHRSTPMAVKSAPTLTEAATGGESSHTPVKVEDKTAEDSLLGLAGKFFHQ